MLVIASTLGITLLVESCAQGVVRGLMQSVVPCLYIKLHPRDFRVTKLIGIAASALSLAYFRFRVE